MAMADSEGATRDEARISESKKSGNTPSASQVETFHFNTKTAGKSTKLQDERFTKLASLKALFDEGFITVTEYKDRKSQLVDDITGTSTATSSMARGQSSLRGRHVRQEFVPPRPPNFTGCIPEKAISYSFDTKTGEWHQEVVYVQIEKDPFARGALRKAHHLRYVNDNQNLKGASQEESSTPQTTYVAKISADPYEDREVYFADVEMQMYAREWALRFNKFNPPKQIEFIKAAVLQLVEREGSPLCGVERFIDGVYHKHNNNFGFVSEDDRNTPQAFSHFTYEFSNHQIVIVDIQGVADLYTDPQVHTRDGIGFGKGNLGMRGFEKFLSSHRCNAICKYFALPIINEKLEDFGTVPQKPAISVKTITLHSVDVQYESSQFGQKIPAAALMVSPNPRTPLLQPAQRQEKPKSDSGCCVIL